MGSRRQARIIAFQTLFGSEMNPQPISELLKLTWMDAKDREELEPDVQMFCRLLIQGTKENKEAIDLAIRDHLQKWDFDRVGKVDMAILRMSVYQMLYMKDIPVKVVIDEAVDISKKFASDDSYRFINGVLDGIRKEKGL